MKACSALSVLASAHVSPAHLADGLSSFDFALSIRGDLVAQLGERGDSTLPAPSRRCEALDWQGVVSISAKSLCSHQRGSGGGGKAG
jgi:hypothetical protein